ncbi:restriction endonuclease subunit S [Streptococcus suis]|uniref:Restriction endonuclease subunit S n=1 Tax=Streptococcus suis TaxID=1307 RepID=A0A4T2H2I7_STRSU|nr:restriction endonuclease subunit S [Streptococcus suis]MBO3838808.1 restriction endonuclease subunit S [Streptococcus suis]MBO4113033.1 restriction endonuclease subunit S [Streptococcus suis]MDG4480849.1 restriction endonuclease subunit S [Streptococcus suis]MDG4487118.1 restriction endonuclease subunit S [Streptococcus suis]TII06163.1 restriction endonuclease subunit S [Streptococcus suis]
MPNKDRNIPKRRFKAFENADAWELWKLGNTDTIFTDGNYGEAYPKDSDLTTSSNGVPFLRGSNIQDGKLNLDNANYITISKHNELTSGHLEEDDIVIAVRGSLGSVGYVEEDNIGWNINSQLAIIRTNKDEITGRYLIQILLSDSGKKMINSLVTGTALKQLPIKNLKKIQFSIPTLPEQKAIATFFSTLDRQITLHQRKLDKLKNVKQAYLSEMFPAEGERVPKRRFPGFTDDWELRPLGEIGNTYTGLSGKTKDDFGHGDGRFVTYMNVFSNPISLPEMVEAVEIDERQNTVRYGDVLFTTSSETPEEVGMSSVWLENTENTYLNSFCFGFRPVKKVNPYYLAYLLRSSGMRRKISFLAQGISRYNISKTKMMELEISIPNENEQSAIGTFFSTLDQQITLHQRKSI